MKKRVSVAMAVYNSEKYIVEQIESIQQQLLECDELVISYNYSVDNTKAIIDEFALKDPRIKVVMCSNKGLIYNFESAIRETQGEYIFLADHDDVWLPNKIEKVLAIFQEKNVDLIVHSKYVTDSELSILKVEDLSKCSTSFFDNLRHNNYSGACMAFKSWLKPYILPIPKQKIYHDMWIGILAGIYGKTCFIPDILIYYRRHDSNLSVTTKRNIFLIIKERIITFVFLSSRYIRNLLKFRRRPVMKSQV